MSEVTAIATRQAGLDDEQLELLKRTICENATDDEYRMFAGICRRSGLDPFSKQIYFRKYNTQQGPRVTIITGIDGYRLIAQRTGEYEGQTEPEWCGADGTWKQVWLDSKPPAAARVGVWRRGFKLPAYAIAKWSEYYPSNPKERFMWDKMPSNQISKCAEALSLRKAFPQELSGIYTSDEMAQEGRVRPAAVEVEPTDSETNETIRGALGETPKAAPSAAPPATAATTSKTPRANTIKHDGTFASHKQVALLHMLRSKAGIGDCDGKCAKEVKKWSKRANAEVPMTVRCTYHTQLAGFKDCDGKAITTSKDLSEDQISNLIDRYQARVDRPDPRETDPLDLSVIDEATTPQLSELEAAVAGDEARIEAICDTLRVMSISDIRTKERASQAIALALAFGTGAFEPLRKKIMAQVSP